jgi:hypothetical protein
MYPQQSGFSPTVKRWLILGLVGAVVVLVLILVAGYGFISVETTGGTDKLSEITYELTNQGTGKKTTVKSTSAIKKFVTRGRYEVMVRRGSTSYFATVKSSGFFTTKKVSATLAPEKGRRFIGDNPSPCMYLLKDVLVSYECFNTSLNSISRHVPATANQPTYAAKNTSPLEGTIEGLLPTKQGDTVILKAPEIDEDQGAPHTAFTLDSNLNVQPGKALADLTDSQTYTIHPYKDGFLAINNEFVQAQYFADPANKPEVVPVEAPEDEKQEPYTADARGSRMLIAYANETQADRQNPDAEKITRKIDGTLVIRDGSETRKYPVSTKYAAVKLCGDKYLCALSDRAVEVFDVSGKKLKSLYRVQEVSEMLTTTDQLVVVRSGEVMGLDVATGTGTVQYHVENYTTCGIKPTGPSYTLCLINQKDKKVALYIDQQTESDQIDQKVAQLLKAPEVRSLSIYGKFISVSPEVGSLTFIPSRGEFGYDPKRVTTANKAITEAVTKAGIDPATYQVKSTINQ